MPIFTALISITFLSGFIVTKATSSLPALNIVEQPMIALVITHVILKTADNFACRIGMARNATTSVRRGMIALDITNVI